MTHLKVILVCKFSKSAKLRFLSVEFDQEFIIFSLLIFRRFKAFLLKFKIDYNYQIHENIVSH